MILNWLSTKYAFLPIYISPSLHLRPKSFRREVIDPNNSFYGFGVSTSSYQLHNTQTAGITFGIFSLNSWQLHVCIKHFCTDGGKHHKIIINYRGSPRPASTTIRRKHVFSAKLSCGVEKALFNLRSKSAICLLKNILRPSCLFLSFSFRSCNCHLAPGNFFFCFFDTLSCFPKRNPSSEDYY